MAFSCRWAVACSARVLGCVTGESTLAGTAPSQPGPPTWTAQGGGTSVRGRVHGG